MKQRESVSLTTNQLNECKELGARLSRLRKARGVLQSEAAVRAGISRPTAVRIEAGDPGRTLGQLLRYLQAIVPEMTLAQLIQGGDPSLKALEESEQTKRVRRLSEKELKELDF